MTTTKTYVSSPGEILKEEFLEPLDISQYRLAQAIGKPQSAVSDIVHNKRSITPEMAHLIGKALGTTPEFWLHLQTTYQIKALEQYDLSDIKVLVN